MEPVLDPHLPILQPRPRDGHKGTFGRVLVVAGSRDMSGAAVLCGSAALRGGAGLVRVAVPASVQPIVAVGNPLYTTARLPEDEHGQLAGAAEAVLTLARDYDVVAVGPGLGRSEGVAVVVQALIEESDRPLVIDADGINVLAGQTDRLHARAGALVLTPHPGEFARLTGRSVAEVQADRVGLAVAFAQEHGLVLLLKGMGTVVTDGTRVHVNTTGNPGMASGGTGDVLTGLIAALLGQGLAAFEAAALGAYLHGLAGDLAAEELGEEGLTAGDVVMGLPRAFRRYRELCQPQGRGGGRERDDQS